MGNRFGHLFAITTFGESHGPAIGVVIDGVPAKLAVSLEAVQAQLDRRRPGQSKLTTSRAEKDRVVCWSGLENNMTLGTPLTLVVVNEDQRPEDYQELTNILRPSHADFTTLAKYGIKSSSGGGRASARETIGRVAAGAIAEQLLQHKFKDYEVVAWVQSVGTETATVEEAQITRDAVDQSEVRCPDASSAARMTANILAAKESGDSLGGVIRCVIRGVPAGLGEPVFDKLEADLAKAMLSLPAVKGFEIGSGFAGTQMKGSEHNDAFVQKEDRVGTSTNHSGGVQGGISNGEPIVFNVAFKPVATIAQSQETLTTSGKPTVMNLEGGRHDPCVLPRAVPMVEAMANLVIVDHLLRSLNSRLS